MTPTDALELVVAGSLIIAYISGGMWLRRNRRQWRMIVPAFGWLLNVTLFMVTVLVANTYEIRLSLNLWSLTILTHGAFTFALYFRLMRPHERH